MSSIRAVAIPPTVTIIFTGGKYMASALQAMEPDAAAAALGRADTVDLDVLVRRYVNKRNTSAVRARQVLREMKRFLVMCALEPHKGLIISGEVDEMWHMFILFTRRYEDFCQKVAGRFIHHVPGEDMAHYYTDKTPAHSYRVTFETYERLFGEAPDPSVWPSPPSDAETPQDPYPCEGGGGSGPRDCGPPKDPGGPGQPGFP
jgi:hypothetical protein